MLFLNWTSEGELLSHIIQKEADRRGAKPLYYNRSKRDVMHVCKYLSYLSMFFEDFSGLRGGVREVELMPGRVVDNTLLGNVFFSAVGSSARALHVTLVPIGLALWSG